jgi:hypothetical protein
MSSTQPIRVSSLQGEVSQGVYAKGSKSERKAIFIETPDARRYILRRKIGPAFGDSELTQYLGHEIKCDGFVVGTTLLAEHIEVIR